MIVPPGQNGEVGAGLEPLSTIGNRFWDDTNGNGIQDAGESGILGREEIRVIEPELKSLRGRLRGKAKLVGPLPADTLFAQHSFASKKDRYDAVVCMYHDQGLIPVKLLDFPRTVNITLGLPMVRTSVDHGVAFDIAGQGIADPSSFESAVDLAIKIVRNRQAAKGKRL